MDDDEMMAFELDGVEEASEPYQPIKRFEDLIAWQRARELTAEIYRMTRQPSIRHDAGLCGQMQRAAVSIMTNIAEGHERGSTQEYHRFLTIAKGSCAELRSLLYVALDAEYINQDTFDEHLALTERVGQLVGALRSAIARRLASQRNKE